MTYDNTTTGLAVLAYAYMEEVSHEGLVITVVSGIFSLATIATNALVLTAYFRDRACATQTYIVSLAVSDILTASLSLPLATQYFINDDNWQLGPALCDLWLSIDYAITRTAHLKILLITMDRYLSVKIPIRYCVWRTKSRVIALMAISWLVPALFFLLLINLPPLFMDDSTGNKCIPLFLAHVELTLTVTVCLFWIPMLVTVILYTLIYEVAESRLIKRRLSLISNTIRIRLTPMLGKHKQPPAPRMTPAKTSFLWLGEAFDPGRFLQVGESSVDISPTFKLDKINEQQEQSLATKSTRSSGGRSQAHGHLEPIVETTTNTSSAPDVKTSLTAVGTPPRERLPDLSTQTKKNPNPFMKNQNTGNFNAKTSKYTMSSTTDYRNSAVTYASKDKKSNWTFSTLTKSLDPSTGLTGESSNTVTSSLRSPIYHSSSASSLTRQSSRVRLPTHDQSGVYKKGSIVSQIDRSGTVVTKVFQFSSVVDPPQFGGRKSSPDLFNSRFVGGLTTSIRGKAETRETERANKDQARKSFRSISWIMGVFLVCFVPWNVVIVLETTEPGCVNSTVFHTVFWLYYLNSFANPILYALKTPSFKKAIARYLKFDFHRT